MEFNFVFLCMFFKWYVCVIVLLFSRYYDFNVKNNIIYYYTTTKKCTELNWVCVPMAVGGNLVSPQDILLNRSITDLLTCTCIPQKVLSHKIALQQFGAPNRFLFPCQ